MGLWIAVDCETDGPAPGPDLYSLVSFGAVIVEPGLHRRFKGLCAPISKKWNPKALAISNISREEHEEYDDPAITLRDFDIWLRGETDNERPTFVSDNNGFDWCFINFYLWTYVGSNHFGWGSRRLNDLCAGWKNNANATQYWKQYRKTKHTHDPVDDAMGVAEALLEMKRRGLRIDAIPEPVEA